MGGAGKGPLFPPHPFFKGKALGTRLYVKSCNTYFFFRRDHKVKVTYYCEETAYVVGRERWEKGCTHIPPFFSRFVNFFGGGGGEGAIFALAISGQLKRYLSPSHLHLRYFLVSRALARNLLYLGLLLLTSLKLQPCRPF